MLYAIVDYTQKNEIQNVRWTIHWKWQIVPTDAGMKGRIWRNICPDEINRYHGLGPRRMFCVLASPRNTSGEVSKHEVIRLCASRLKTTRRLQSVSINALVLTMVCSMLPRRPVFNSNCNRCRYPILQQMNAHRAQCPTFPLWHHHCLINYPFSIFWHK